MENVEIGITPQHLGIAADWNDVELWAIPSINCDADCMALGVKAVKGDNGPWKLSDEQRKAVEDALGGEGA